MDARRFESIYAEHADRVYAFLVYRTGDPAASEDLLADVFERVLRKRRSFDRAKGSELSWLYAIALNLVRDRHRRHTVEHRGLERMAAGHADSTADVAEGVAERMEVLDAIAELSADEREVVALRFGAGLTAPQIATALDAPLTTVEGRLYRALRKLRQRLEQA